MRLDDVERQRLHRTFESLCGIESPTGEERACADWIGNELRALGLEVEEDSVGELIGCTAGNLLVRIPGSGPRSLLFCAHMDTVPPSGPIRPIAREGRWENEHDAILGADNKAAVAGLVELARHLVVAGSQPEVGVELLFTVAEETGLGGAREFDAGKLRSEFGYVFDHASPLGEIIATTPTHMWVTGEIRGRAAHAGLEPERGHNAIVAAAHAVVAMPQGRIDPYTTANVGMIAGGTAQNVVAERCTVRAEVRAVEQATLDLLVTRSIDALQDAADAAACDLDVEVRRMYTGYRLRAGEPSVVLAQQALRTLGYEPKLVATGGGSDANALRSGGFQCTNLANGTERAHQPDESVTFTALEQNLALMLTLHEGAAEPGEERTADAAV